MGGATGSRGSLFDGGFLHIHHPLKPLDVWDLSQWSFVPLAWRLAQIGAQDFCCLALCLVQLYTEFLLCSEISVLAAEGDGWKHPAPASTRSGWYGREVGV